MSELFLDYLHFDNGVLSIEPNSRNLIIYADTSDNSISVRGPYTIDTALENESNTVRMPVDAMMTLGIEPNEALFIDDSQVNVDAAAKLGFQTMCVEPYTDFSDKLL